MAGIEEHPQVLVFDEISRIDQGVRGVISRALPVGLPLPQFDVLNLLARRGDDQTPAQIATALQMTPGAITNTLQRLEVTKLIIVESCVTDRRKKLVRMSAEGREAYLRSMTAIRPNMSHLREAFSSTEFEEALPFLRALRAWLSDQA